MSEEPIKMSPEDAASALLPSMLIADVIDCARAIGREFASPDSDQASSIAYSMLEYLKRETRRRLEQHIQDTLEHIEIVKEQANVG